MCGEARVIEVSRTIAAPAPRIFAFLADPANHWRFDTSGMVRGPAHPGAFTGVGQVFVMNIHNDMKRDHQDENHVIVYEPDRAIGWAPAEPGEEPAGHTWVWRLTPDGEQRTIVNQTNDWSRFTHLDMLSHLPVVNRHQLQASLDRLSEALE